MKICNITQGTSRLGAIVLSAATAFMVTACADSTSNDPHATSRYFDSIDATGHLIYANDFEDPSDLDDWVIEGPGQISIEDGQLKIGSMFARQTLDFLNQGGTDVDTFVSNLMKHELGEARALESYRGDKFQGAHFVGWNTFPTPADFVLEVEFTNVSDHPLHMIMFSHLGLNDESVFDPTLQPRTGVSSRYSRGDLKGYRVSFFNPPGPTANLRRSPDRKLLTTGPDTTDENPTQTHHLQIIKRGPTVTWTVNGQTTFGYTEQDPAQLLAGGYFALRLMNPAIGLYDNLRIYALED